MKCNLKRKGELEKTKIVLEHKQKELNINLSKIEELKQKHAKILGPVGNLSQMTEDSKGNLISKQPQMPPSFTESKISRGENIKDPLLYHSGSSRLSQIRYSSKDDHSGCLLL